ncbi:MAG: dihydropteroate synthase [Halobacteriales archaeon]
MRTVDAAGLPIGDGHPPRVMGVLNLSPASPYDPSVFEDPAAAARYVDGLVEEGADIVDVGLESANKRFEVKPADWELDRLDLALDTLERVEADPVFSIETRYGEVAEAALSGGFDMVNDVAGFADPELPAVCADHGAAVVKMAGGGDLERPGAVEDVDAIYDALAEDLTEKTIVDPAFGGWTESKTLADDRETFRRLREFRGLGQPILVSINRKNFLKDLVGRDTEGALPASLGATAMAVERGANVVRTHDVAETRDAALVGYAFARERACVGPVEELDVTTVAEAERHLERVGGATDGAGELVGGAYRIDGLDDAAAERLTAAAADTGVQVASGPDAAVVGGTAAALDDLADRLDGGPLAALTRAIRA